MIARFIQGLGSGACWIVGNACIKDLYEGKEYTKVMNYVHAIAGIIPAIAPSFGSKIAVLMGWKSCFWILTFIGGCIWIGIFFKQKETLKVYKSFSVKSSVKDYLKLFYSLPFCIYLFIKVIAVTLIFVETSNIPLIFIDYLAVLPENFGYYILPSFLFYVLSSIASSYLCERFSINMIITIGLMLIFMSQITILALPNVFQDNPIFFQGIKCFSYIGWGFIFGNATAQIVSQLPDCSASASAIMIGLEMLFSSLGIFLMGIYFDGTVVPITIFMAICSFVCLLVLTFASKQLKPMN